MDKLNNDILVSVVIPVYNAELTIENLVDKLIFTLKPVYNFEIILINDCSSDNSNEVCINLHSKYKNYVHFFSLSKNVGEHNAVMAGLNKCRGNYVVTMDDDLQNPVSEVLKLLSYVDVNDFDVVYSYFHSKKHSIFRNIGSKFNDFIANIMIKKPKDLYLSSFKVMNRFLVNEIIKYDSPFPYIDGLILRTTNRIGKLPVEHHERPTGKSNYTLKKLFSLWLNMFTNFSILPLRASTYLGFSIALVSFFYGFFTIIEKMLNPKLPVGFAAMTVSLSLFAGVQLIAIGMIGEYVGRIFLSINKKPQYTIHKQYTDGG